MLLTAAISGTRRGPLIAEVVRYFDADIDLIDVDPITGNLDPYLLEKYLAENCVTEDGVCLRKHDRKRVRAIMPVHLAGLVCEMTPVSNLAKQYNITVIEDAAHSFPAT